MKKTITLLVAAIFAFVISSPSHAQHPRRTYKISYKYLRANYEKCIMFDHFRSVYENQMNGKIKGLLQLLEKCGTSGTRAFLSMLVDQTRLKAKDALSEYDRRVWNELFADFEEAARTISKDVGFDELYLVGDRGEMTRLLHPLDDEPLAKPDRAEEIEVLAVRVLNRKYLSSLSWF